MVAIVILNYKGFEDTCECIDSLHRLSYKDYRIIVVDNDSQDGSYEKLCEKYPNIRVIPSGRNLGFAGGNNIGIAYAMETGAEYICIMNNDVTVEPDFLEKLVAKMKSNSRVGAVGPLVKDYYHRQLPGVIGSYMNMRTGEGKNLYQGQAESEKERRMLRYIPGCCMLLRTSAIEQVGKIPTAYFMFYEETEWAVRLQQEGIKLATEEAAILWHKESASMEGQSEFKKHFLQYNRILFEKRNATKPDFVLFCIYFILQNSYRCLFRKQEYTPWHTFWNALSGKEEEKYADFFRNLEQ